VEAGVVAGRFRQRTVQHYVADDHPPAGRQHAIYLAEYPGLVGREVDDAVGDHHIHAGVLDGQVFDQPLAELDVRQAGCLEDLNRILAGQGEHFRRHVHALGQ